MLPRSTTCPDYLLVAQQTTTTHDSNYCDHPNQSSQPRLECAVVHQLTQPPTRQPSIHSILGHYQRTSAHLLPPRARPSWRGPPLSKLLWLVNRHLHSRRLISISFSIPQNLFYFFGDSVENMSSTSPTFRGNSIYVFTLSLLTHKPKEPMIANLFYYAWPLMPHHHRIQSPVSQHPNCH